VSVQGYGRAVTRHQKELSRLQREKAQVARKLGDENRKAHAAADQAGRTKSAAIMRSKLRTAKRHEDNAAKHQQKLGEIEGKLSREQSRLVSARRNLSNAEDQERKKEQREHNRDNRARAAQIGQITGTLNRHEKLHDVALSAIRSLSNLPKEIVVLVLAANPRDQHQLRLDDEVRSITEMIRKSEHRDAIRLESRWAARPLDLLQAVNELRPRVVHFSGHGTHDDRLAFHGDEGLTKFVTKEAMAQTLAAASSGIQVAFFNACYSRGQAEAVVEHVPMAIGMSTSIGDEAARVFAAQFYSAIGFGLSVGAAFRQAKAALMLEGIPEEDVPELFLAEGLDADQMVLVKPPEPDGGNDN
jgi:hypothetical protein